jgi:hypothetical protein
MELQESSNLFQKSISLVFNDKMKALRVARSGLGSPILPHNIHVLVQRLIVQYQFVHDRVDECSPA